MSEVSAVRIRLAVDGASQVTSALGGVQTGLGKLEGATKTVGKGLATMGGAFAALGLGVSISAMGGWVRGAIDAADAATKMAQKTGLAVKEVAGLQLAFRQAGAGERFQETLSKLAAEATKGNTAFAAMGIAVNSSTGGLKSTRDLLAEVSNKFAGYRDGAEKTALVQKIFGESGAALIPLLNAGAGALDEYDKTAAALGLTINETTGKAAEKFNDTLDLVGQSTQGVARQVAAQLLPTLNILAGELLGAATNTGFMTGAANLLGASFRALYSIGVGVVEAFKTVGTALGGVGAAIAAILRGDFGQVRGIVSDMASDISASWAGAGASIQRAWGDAENTTVSALAAITKETRAAAPSVDALTKATTANKDALKAETEALRARIAAGQSANTAFDEEFKIVEAAREAIEGRIKSGREMLESIERETALMGLSNTEREQSIALFALEKAGVIAGTEAYDAYAAKIREAISARGNKQAAIDAVAAETAATAQAAKDATAEWQKTADSINSSLTDALMRGFEDGKGFAKNLADTLKNMFRTLVLRPIISAVLAPIAGGLSGAVNAATGGGGDVTSLFSQLNSSLSNSIGKSFGEFARSSSGQSLGLSESSAMGPLPGGGSLTANGQLASQGLQVLGDTLAGYAIGSMAKSLISNGYSVGKGMENFQKAGIAVASAFFGPVGGAIAGAISGGINALFGRKLKDSGVEGAFGGQEGFSGNTFEFLKGGFLRSDKTNRNPIDEEVRKGLGDAFGAMRIQVGTFASALGLNTAQIAGFTSSIKLSLKGLSAEDADKKIKEAMGAAGNALAAQVLGDSGFARAGEEAGATLQRLASSLMTVNAVFDTLGKTALEASLAGGDLASKLADAFGGLENFTSASGTFFEAFYSEAERTETATLQLTETLGKLGIALPNTGATDALAQYRALVEVQDLNTESGRNAFAALVTLSGGFAQLVDSTEQLGQAASRAAQEMISAAASRTDAAFAALERAVGAQQNIIGTQISAAQSLASEVSSIFDALKSSVDDLYRSVDSAAQQSAAQARAFITQALSGALATGSLPDSKALQDAISAARTGMDDTQFASQFESDRARLVLAGQLSQLKEIAGDQLSETERQIQLLKGQLSALDSTLVAARAQIDVMLGIDTSVLSVKAAIDALALAVLSQQALKLQQQDASSAARLQTGVFNRGGSVTTAAGSTVSASEFVGNTDAMRAQSYMASNPDVAAAFATGDTYGLSAAEFATVHAALYGLDEGRKFARGGMHAGGVRLVGERGPELEFTGPSRIFSAGDSARMMGGGNSERLERLVEGLTAEVTRLRADVARGNENTRQLADQFDSVSAGGNALATEVMP